MRNILFIIICISIFYSCQYKVKEYDKDIREEIKKEDTIHIQRIKIKTH